jgi:Cupredoxin-like domain
MEFESVSLRVEKVVGGNRQVRIRPLSPGRYQFYDDFNQQVEGVLVVK